MLWQIKQMQFTNKNVNWFYFSYTSPLAQYHLKYAKRYMAEMMRFGYFPGFESISDAESILHYRYKRKEARVDPTGIGSFKRGIHGNVALDDILKDERTKGRLSIVQIQKITDIFTEEISFIPGKDQQLLLVGTPQDTQDIFFKLKGQPNWDWRSDPAIKKDKSSLWPEVFPLEDLEAERILVGDHAFNKEMLCKPARLEDSYLDPDKLEAQFILKKPPDSGVGVGGHDIGKKAHPSHASIFRLGRDGVMYQLEELWMDGWPYTRQIAWWERKIKDHHLGLIYYDKTRAEFEGLAEQGQLPREMGPITMSQRTNQAMAAELDVRVCNGTIWFIPSEDEFGADRQLSQMLSMDNDPKAPSSVEGHADSFVSAALACHAAAKLAKKVAPEGPVVDGPTGRSKWRGRY